MHIKNFSYESLKKLYLKVCKKEHIELQTDEDLDQDDVFMFLPAGALDKPLIRMAPIWTSPMQLLKFFKALVKANYEHLITEPISNTTPAQHKLAVLTAALAVARSYGVLFGDNIIKTSLDSTFKDCSNTIPDDGGAITVHSNMDGFYTLYKKPLNLTLYRKTSK